MNTNSDPRFANLDLDDSAPKARAPQAPTAPAPLSAAAVRTGGESAGRAGEIDAEGRARAIASATVADKHGLVGREPTLFAWGTRGQWGQAAYRARMELRERPLVRDFAAQAQAQIKAEGRRADAVALTTLKYGADDRLRTRPDSKGAPCTPQSFRQLLNRADAPGHASSYLGHPSLDGAMRAPHVQHWLDRAVETVRGSAAPTPVKGVILSKIMNGAHHVYGVVSETYTRYDVDRVLSDVVNADGIPATARGSMRYDASTTRWSLDLAVGAEFEPVVGDVHRVVLRISGHDAGGGSITVQLFAERVRCLNFSKVHLSQKVRNRIRHTGAGVGAQVRALLAVQAEALKDFSDVWAEANQTALIGEALQGKGEAKDVFRALISAGHVDAPEGEEIAVERFYNAWLEEPGHNRSDFVNAITRAAHTAPWASPWAGEALEEQAADLLYNHVVITPDWRQAA